MEEGQAKCTYGTGAFLLVHTGGRGRPLDPGPDHHPRRQPRSDGPPRYALEGSVFIAGAAVQWFRDGLKAVGAAPEVDRLSEAADPDSGVLFVPALTGLGAPLLGARGEGDPLRPDPGHLRRRPRPGDPGGGGLPDLRPHRRDERRPSQSPGGTSGSTAGWPGPTRSSTSRPTSSACSLQRSPQAESTALGAALLAGLGVGLWPDPATAAGLLQEGGRAFHPRRDDAWRSAASSRWRHAVETVRRHYRTGLA